MTKPEHEPEADSSERPNTTQKALEAQMQAAAGQIAKAKKGIGVTAEDLLVRFSADTKNAEVGIARMDESIAGFAKAAAAAYDFGEGMTEVNRIIDEEDE